MKRKREIEKQDSKESKKEYPSKIQKILSKCGACDAEVDKESIKNCSKCEKEVCDDCYGTEEVCTYCRTKCDKCMLIVDKLYKCENCEEVLCDTCYGEIACDVCDYNECKDCAEKDEDFWNYRCDECDGTVCKNCAEDSTECEICEHVECKTCSNKSPDIWRVAKKDKKEIQVCIDCVDDCVFKVKKLKKILKYDDCIHQARVLLKIEV